MGKERKEGREIADKKDKTNGDAKLPERNNTPDSCNLGRTTRAWNYNRKKMPKI